MSGNSSVCNRQSAKSPNTTNATIVTTVIMGRLMAKSEITMRSAPLGRLRVRRRRVDDRCGHPHRCSRRDSLSGTGQQRVAGTQAGENFRRLQCLVVDADGYLHLLDLATLHPHNAGRGSAPIDRGAGHNQARSGRRGNPATREQSAYERSAGIWNRDIDAYLTRRRIRGRIDANDTSHELTSGVAAYRERYRHADSDLR